MKPGEKFELESFEYLKDNYSNNNIKFIHHNTTDSTKSDIEVFINGKSKFFIEAKDMAAQSGQFVLLSNDDEKLFTFSPRNKSIPNEMTNIIIEYMNKNYDRFNNAGTSGEKIDIDSSIFVKWIIEHYKEKKVKYFISKKNNIIILPIDKFGDYFEVSANFRIKKSGSREPSVKYFDNISKFLYSKYNIKNIYTKTISKKKKLFVDSTENLSKIRFELDKNNYYLSPQKLNNIFEVKQLSNTRNKNVIFTINIKKEQDLTDLECFKSELI